MRRKDEKMLDLSNEEMIHMKKDGIEYLQFRKLLSYQDLIVHCYTLKGIDVQPYEFSKENLIDGYHRIGKALEIENKKIVRPIQTHSDHIEIVSNINLENDFNQHDFDDVDGLVTAQKDIYLALRYADCLPLYFFDPVKEVVANIHSGWKGSLKHIGEKAVRKMVEEFGSHSYDILCFIGPSIKSCHFEVEEDVKKQFEEDWKGRKTSDAIIEKGKIKEGKQKYYIDTVKMNRVLLREMGLKDSHIIDSNICTVCQHEWMHSYRAEKDKAGRNAAIIGVRGKN